MSLSAQLSSRPRRCLPCLAALLAPLLDGCRPADLPARPGGQPETPAAVSPARGEFESVLGRWKTTIGELHELEFAFHTSGANELEKISRQYHSTLAEGFSQEAELVETAIRTFAADPEPNQDLKVFLTFVSSQLVAADDYENALRITQAMIDNQIEDLGTYQNAADAAFACCEFDLAEQYLRTIAKSESRESPAKRRLQLLPVYREEWRKERKLRETEQLSADLPRVLLRTERGEIELELFENEAPNTVANFVSLVERGFYNNLTFHRVESGVSATAGDPHADGSGSPGYFLRHEYDRPDRRCHFRGSLSTVPEGPLANGCQFCLAFQPLPQQEGACTVFGRMLRGLEVLSRLQRVGGDAFPQHLPPDRIIEARVVRKRDHPYKPSVIPDPDAEIRKKTWERMKRLLSR